MAVRVRIPPLDYHPGQLELLRHRRRFNVVRCGRRWGKTLFGLENVLLEPGGAIDGSPTAWFAPSYRYLLEVWDSAEETLRPVLKKASRQDMRISLRTGGLIDFWSLEDPNAGRSRKYKRVVVDEAAHVRNLKDAWEKSIRPTLTDYRGDAWLISTPNGLNYFHDLHKRGEDQSEKEWATFHQPTYSNPHMAPEEIDGARRELPELVFRQEYLAEFVIFGAGLIKPEFIVEGVCPDHLPTVLGVDLAISEKQTADWTVIVAMSRCPDTGRIYIREVERHRAGFHEVLQRITAAAARWRPMIIAIEQVQFQAAVIQELTRTTLLPVRGIKPDRDKLTRFSPLITRYEQRKVTHDPSRVPPWFRDEVLSFPQGNHDDGVDACSIAYAALGRAETHPVMIQVPSL